MGLILFAFTGAFLGWLAAAIKEIDEGIFEHLGIGMLGALLGAFIASLFMHHGSIVHLTWLKLVFSVIGAIALLNITGGSSGYEPHDT